MQNNILYFDWSPPWNFKAFTYGLYSISLRGALWIKCFHQGLCCGRVLFPPRLLRLLPIQCIPKQKTYCWWKKSCTTWDVQNPVNNGIFAISTGAGFLPSTVVDSTVIKIGCFQTRKKSYECVSCRPTQGPKKKRLEYLVFFSNGRHKNAKLKALSVCRLRVWEERLWLSRSFMHLYGKI